MVSDNFEWMKANEPQSLGDYSPYVDKQYTTYINDINNGVYANNSLTLVNFDLGQIYNSNKYLLILQIYTVFYQSQWSPLTEMATISSLQFLDLHRYVLSKQTF
jgi:hypothetical protein